MEGDGRVKEGRVEDQEDQGTLKQQGGVPTASFYLFLVILAFLLALP